MAVPAQRSGVRIPEQLPHRGWEDRRLFLLYLLRGGFERVSPRLHCGSVPLTGKEVLPAALAKPCWLPWVPCLLTSSSGMPQGERPDRGVDVGACRKRCTIL